MSKIIVTDPDDTDLPCNSWEGTKAEVDKCPVKTKWCEGEEVICAECGWWIGMNSPE